ncbi:MAG: hypothetical protein K5928_06860 [Prevotella sp.]|nr:hypothetical protein [Prevotella sp.]
MKHSFFLLPVMLLCPLSAFCIDEADKPSQHLTSLAQKQTPLGFDNYSFYTVHFDRSELYNNRSMSLLSVYRDSIEDVKISPANVSLSVVHRNKHGRRSVTLYDLIKKTVTRVYRFPDANISSATYSRDGRQLAIAADNRQVRFFEPGAKVAVDTLTTGVVPLVMTYSPNGYFLAVSDHQTLEVWNLEDRNVRKVIVCDDGLNDVCFAGNGLMVVMKGSGCADIYDTRSFEKKATITHLGSARQVSTDADGKYMAAVMSDSLICLVNMLRPQERRFYTAPEKGVTDVRMVYNNNNDQWSLLYNTSKVLNYVNLYDLKPYLNKMLADELNERMNTWMRKMPGESLEEYNLRVNEDTRKQQAMTFEREIATGMAGNILQESDVYIGDYNTGTKKLTVKFNSMPDIFLDVDMDEVGSFSDARQLEFRNMQYGLMQDDGFEMVYAEVYNRATGKTYTFDNRQRMSLSQLQEDDSFVPLSVIQTSQREETQLVSIKEDVVREATQQQRISNKTHINVNTSVSPSVNASGEKIINYNVEFKYEVEEAFSARDDFKPGQFHAENSEASKSMLAIMKKAFENEFAKYVREGKKVKFTIKGTADAAPITGIIAYDGRYGEYHGEPVYQNKELGNISLTRREGINDNRQLAFARAMSVKSYINKELKSFGKMKSDYEYHIEVANDKGGQYRRISVMCTFIDAFSE